MFYLIEILKGFKKEPIKYSLFSVMTGVLFLVATQGSFVTTSVTKKMAQVEIAPYMNALISGRENYSRISRKVEDLPGVSRVKVLDQSWVVSKMKKVLNNIDQNLKEDISKVNYAGLKIIFKDGLNASTQNLIKDYITRLAGKDNVTLSQVKANQKKGKKVFAKKWGQYVVLIGVFILWFCSFLWLKSAVSRTAFCIEQFQRRSHVSLKIYFSFFTGLIIVSLPTVLTWGVPQILNLSFVLILSIAVITLFSRTNRWAN